MTIREMRHDVWVSKNGQRPDSRRRVRDSMDACTPYEHRHKSPPSPVMAVECGVCHEKTIARSPDSPTLAGWTVGEWPAAPQEWGKVGGVCRECNKAQAGAE